MASASARFGSGSPRPPVVPVETLEFLDSNGYCTVPAVLDAEKCELVRSMMDEFLGPPCDHIDFKARGMQKGSMWPERSAAEGGGPLLTEEGPYMHSLQHPIPDARTALPVPPLLEVMSDVLRADPDDLVLIHQNFRRTDPSPGPHPEIRPDGTFDGAKAGFHQDSAFLLSHYDTSPRQNYYICILAFTPVVSGGAAFVYAPGSMAAARAGAAAVPAQLAESVTAAVSAQASLDSSASHTCTLTLADNGAHCAGLPNNFTTADPGRTTRKGARGDQGCRSRSHF